MKYNFAPIKQKEGKRDKKKREGEMKKKTKTQETKRGNKKLTPWIIE